MSFLNLDKWPKTDFSQSSQAAIDSMHTPDKYYDPKLYISTQTDRSVSSAIPLKVEALLFMGVQAHAKEKHSHKRPQSCTFIREKHQHICMCAAPDHCVLRRV